MQNILKCNASIYYLQKIDLAATGLTVTYARSKVVDFCIPFMDDPLSLLIPYPELDGANISAISKPFRYEASCKSLFLS